MMTMMMMMMMQGADEHGASNGISSPAVFTINGNVGSGIVEDMHCHTIIGVATG